MGGFDTHSDSGSMLTDRMKMLNGAWRMGGYGEGGKKGGEGRRRAGEGVPRQNLTRTPVSSEAIKKFRDEMVAEGLWE